MKVEELTQKKSIELYVIEGTSFHESGAVHCGVSEPVDQRIETHFVFSEKPKKDHAKSLIEMADKLIVKQRDQYARVTGLKDSFGNVMTYESHSRIHRISVGTERIERGYNNNAMYMGRQIIDPKDLERELEPCVD